MKATCARSRRRWTGLTLLAGGVVLGLTQPLSQAASPVATPLGAHSQRLQAPARLATDNAANAYVTDPARGQVVVFDAFGRITSVKQGFAGPLAIAVDSRGNIFLSEEQTRSVTVFDSQWTPLYKLGGGDGEFSLPNHLALDPAPGSNTVYVCDGNANQIKVYRNGEAVTNFGGPGIGDGQFNFPAGICVSAAGEVFVVDQGNDRVQVFDRNGGFLRKFKLGSGGMFGGLSGRSQGIAGDNQGRIFVADSFQGFIRVFGTNGASLGTIGGFGEALGKFRTPAGIAMDSLNRLCVASVNNSRVELLGLDAYLHLSAAPAGQFVAAGTNVTFSAAVGGTGPFTYQWRKGTINLSDGGNVSGATNAALQLTTLTAADAGAYSVVVDGPSGTFTSPEAALLVLMSPTLVTPPANQIAAQGSDVTFNVAAAGDSLAYQWLFNGLEMVDATADVLQLANAQPADSGLYSVVVSNAVGAETSAAVLSVLVPPSITSQPPSRSVIQWDTVTFEVLAAGDLPAYQWFFNNDAIPGANASLLVLTNVQQSGDGAYSVVVSNLVGAAFSDAAQLTVAIPPPPTNAPQIDTVTLRPDNTIHLAALGEPGHAFALIASTNLVDWEILTHVVSTTGTIKYVDPNAPGFTQRFYRVVWTP